MSKNHGPGTSGGLKTWRPDLREVKSGSFVVVGGLIKGTKNRTEMGEWKEVQLSLPWKIYFLDYIKRDRVVESYWDGKEIMQWRLERGPTGPVENDQVWNPPREVGVVLWKKKNLLRVRTYWERWTLRTSTNWEVRPPEDDLEVLGQVYKGGDTSEETKWVQRRREQRIINHKRK